MNQDIDKEVAELFERQGYDCRWNKPLVTAVAAWARKREAKILRKEAGYSAKHCICVFGDDESAPLAECDLHKGLRQQLAAAIAEREKAKP